MYPLENLAVNCIYYLWEAHLQVGEQYSGGEAGRRGCSGSVRWLSSALGSLPLLSLCVCVCECFYFLRFFLHLVFRDNDLLAALTSQMRPLGGSCIQEKQKSCGSLAPLFHFLLLSWLRLWYWTLHCPQCVPHSSSSNRTNVSELFKDIAIIKIIILIAYIIFLHLHSMILPWSSVEPAEACHRL